MLCFCKQSIASASLFGLSTFGLRKKQPDNSQRIKHGALMDSLLLAGVYVELLGERQATLGLGGQGGAEASIQLRIAPAKPRPEPLPPRLLEEGELAHRTFVKTLGPKALWLRFFA